MFQNVRELYSKSRNQIGSTYRAKVVLNMSSYGKKIVWTDTTPLDGPTGVSTFYWTLFAGVLPTFRNRVI